MSEIDLSKIESQKMLSLSPLNLGGSTYEQRASHMAHKIMGNNPGITIESLRSGLEKVIYELNKNERILAVGDFFSKMKYHHFTQEQLNMLSYLDKGFSKISVSFLKKKIQ